MDPSANWDIQVSEDTPRAKTLASIREDITRCRVAIESDSKAAGAYKQTLLHLRVLEQLYTVSDFILVGLGSDFYEGGLRLYAKPQGSPYYMELNKAALRRFISEAARHLTPPTPLTGAQVKQIMDTFQDKPTIITNIERRVFFVSEDLYYDLDQEPGEQLVHGDQLAPDAKCFFKLFTSGIEDKDIISFPPETFNKAFSKQVSSAYNSLLSQLEELCPNPEDTLPAASLEATTQADDPLPRHFKFIEEWANNNPGLYWDLMTIPATVFLKEKPSVSFFLSGSAMNGKSSYLGLIHTVLGSSNTTRVKLSEMGKWHLNTMLQYTIFNAPDDEGDEMLENEESAKLFKSIASHATIPLPIMRSQAPMMLHADFMSAHPMNAFPDWGTTSSSSALTRRTCLIPFTADFRNTPPTKPSGNFARDTFTPAILAKFIGEVLALASFYSEHPIKWSATAESLKGQVEAENDTARLYKKSFLEYFNGFQSMKMLHNDYTLWCRSHGYSNILTQEQLKIHWLNWLGKENQKRITVRQADGTTSPRCYCQVSPEAKVEDLTRNGAGKPYRLPMVEYTPVPGLPGGPRMVGDLHGQNIDAAVGGTYSAVALLESNGGWYGN